MATKGKQLRFNLEREREREILLLLRQARAKGVGVFLRGHPALDEVARELVTVTLASSPASLRSPRETFLSNSTEREKTGAGSNLGQTSSRTCRTQASSSSWWRQTEMGAESLAAASSTPHVKRRLKKFFFVQISVFVRGQKMSSELIHLLLDKTMARPEPRNRKTNPSNRPTKCKTVFVDSQRRDAAGRTLTRSDKDSVLKNPSNGMQNLSILCRPSEISRANTIPIWKVTRLWWWT